MLKKIQLSNIWISILVLGILALLTTSCGSSSSLNNDGVYYDPSNEDGNGYFEGSYFTDGNTSQGFVEADDASDIHLNNDAFNYVSENNQWQNEAPEVTVNNYFGNGYGYNPGFYGMNPYMAFNPYSGWYTYRPGFTFNMGWSIGFQYNYGMYNPYYNPYNWNWGYGYPMPYYGMYSPYYGPSYGNYYGGGGYYGRYPSYNQNYYDVYGRRSSNVVRVSSSSTQQPTNGARSVDVVSPTNRTTASSRTSSTINRTLDVNDTYRTRVRSTNPNTVSPTPNVRPRTRSRSTSPRVRSAEPTRNVAPSRSTQPTRTRSNVSSSSSGSRTSSGSSSSSSRR